MSDPTEALVAEVTEMIPWLMKYCCSNQGRIYGRRLEKLLAEYKGEPYDGGRSSSDHDRAEAANWRERLRPSA